MIVIQSKKLLVLISLLALAAVSQLLLLSTGAMELSFQSLGGAKMSTAVSTLVDLKFVNLVRPRFDASCGSAALSTLFTYYLNNPLGEPELVSSLIRIRESRDMALNNGVTLLDLKLLAESHGQKVVGLKGTIQALAEIDVPAIVFLNTAYPHFVIVKEVCDGQVLIADPAQGHVIYTLTQFESMWNGVLLAVEVEKVRADQGRSWETGSVPSIELLQNKMTSGFTDVCFDFLEF